MKMFSRNNVTCLLVFSVSFLGFFAINATAAEPPIVRSQLHGFSMHPTIKSGEYIVYRRTSVSDLRLGDIVVFRDSISGERVCHRVVEVDSGKVKSKGDNNRFRDRGYISDSNIIGKVTHIGGRNVS